MSKQCQLVLSLPLPVFLAHITGRQLPEPPTSDALQERRQSHPGRWTASPLTFPAGRLQPQPRQSTDEVRDAPKPRVGRVGRVGLNPRPADYESAALTC